MFNIFEKKKEEFPIRKELSICHFIKFVFDVRKVYHAQKQQLQKNLNTY